MDGFTAAPPCDEDDPLHGWQTNSALLSMLHVDNGMSFDSIAALIAEGIGAAVTSDEVKAVCIAVGIVAMPSARPAATPARRSQKGGDAVDPHEPVGCRWIDGDPRGNWSFCQAHQRPDSSYCEHHHSRTRITQKQALAMEARAAEARHVVVPALSKVR